MKTLANVEDKAEIVRRQGTVGPESQRRWGKMDVAEMVCHLSDAMRVAMGERPAGPKNIVLPRRVYKWIALRTPTQWPHGVKTVPECEARVGGTAPAEFARDLQEALGLLERFSSASRDFAFAKHPIFGAMTDEEWMRWGWLHTDHHLRQFGA